MDPQPPSRPDLRDLSAPQVGQLLASLGEKPFRARQVLHWLYARGVKTIAEMSDLGKGLRARLEEAAGLAWLGCEQKQRSADGTVKLLHRLADGLAVESVLIPEADHSTLCVSSQVGCRMGCAFCRTASLGFRRGLTPAELVGQVLVGREEAPPEQPLTNLVFMGMGEPLDNLDHLLVALSHLLGEHGLKFSQRKVTVSTAGLVDRLPLLATQSPAALAVSLNAADDTLRDRLMPINRRFPLAELRQALAGYPLKPTRRITLEYVLLGEVNDRPEQARALARFCQGLRVKLNLIPHNPFPGSPFVPPRQEDALAFQEILLASHLTAIFREPRGADIKAACGLLAGDAMVPPRA